MAAPAPFEEPPTEFSLVLGGPLYQMLRWAHLTGPTLELLRRWIVISVVLCWVPLAVLSLAQAHFLGGAKLSFFHDIETHVRFLVSLPVLILAEMIVHQRIRPVVKSFVEWRVVTPEELPKFYAAIDSTMRILNSVIVEFALLISLCSPLAPGSCGIRKHTEPEFYDNKWLERLHMSPHTE
jgi:hypothetical protein